MTYYRLQCRFGDNKFVIVSKQEFEEVIKWSLATGATVCHRVLTGNLNLTIYTPKLTENQKQYLEQRRK